MTPFYPRPNFTSSSGFHIHHPPNRSYVQPHSKRANSFSAVNSDYGLPLPDTVGDRSSRRAKTSARNTVNDVPLLNNPASPARPPQHRYKRYDSSYSPFTSDSSAIDTPLRARGLLPTTCIELAPNQPVVSTLPDPVRDQNHGQNEQSNSKNTGHSVNWRIKGFRIPENLDYTLGAEIIVTNVPRSALRPTVKGSGCQRSQPCPTRFQPYSQAGRRNAVSLNSGNSGQTPNTHPLPEVITHTSSSCTSHISKPVPTIGEFYTSWNHNKSPDANPLFAPYAAGKLDNVNHARHVHRSGALSNAISTRADEAKGQQGREEMDIDSLGHSPTSLPSHIHPTGHETSSDKHRESARDAFTTPNNPLPNDSPLSTSTSNAPGPRTFSQSAGTTTASSRGLAQSETRKLWKAMYGKDTADLQRDLVTLKSIGIEDIDLRNVVITEER
ncbi:34b77ca2-2b0f-429f-bf17-a9cfb71ce9e9 [Sclerotinia trifoliorum]|uniref:34b77ca2-2b0f-429f-bf17-a9cfb71ce9e9 n=1 Tax=Sclerotinia trifoliorum TaxID=28548 RepID=A0A8H2VMJ8_9HELO|nr:34b77ca2-2b0f-429f-bf17-a9cfb71ce9e9 [Sclerotinia trifoliorum]